MSDFAGFARGPGDSAGEDPRILDELGLDGDFWRLD